MTKKRQFRIEGFSLAQICLGALTFIFSLTHQVLAQSQAPPPLTWMLLRGGVPQGGSAGLQFTVTNSSTTTALKQIQVSDQLPQPLIIASPHNFQSTCNSTAVAAPGTSSITLSISSLAAGASCTLSVDLVVASGAAVDVAVSNTATLSAANTTNYTATANINATTPVASCAANTQYSNDRPSLQTYANPQPTSGQFALSTIFNRPVISRGYEGEVNATLGVSTTTYAQNVSSMHPSYISSLVYLNPKDYVSTTMQTAWYSMRETYLHQNTPGTPIPLDVEISINPRASVPFTSAQDVIQFMQTVQCQLQPDVWFFDFYSDAANSAQDQVNETSWLPTIIQYAHNHNQLVGGNFFSDTGASVPAGTDFVAFVDDNADSTTSYAPYGYGYDTGKIKWLNSQNVFVLGHLQSNPQNEYATSNSSNTNGGTFSCQYMNVPGASPGVYNWTEPNQMKYLTYWASGQQQYGFQFMYPAYYPICPAGVAYDPTQDPDPNTQSQTLLTDIISNLMNVDNKTN